MRRGIEKMQVLGKGTPMADSVLVLTLAYRGSDFSGFARQPGQRTVQGQLETALVTVLRREIVTVCAGRTDAGVHALGQVVSFAADGTEPDDASLQRSLNALCGADAAVTEIRHARPGFSARHSALTREYRYRLTVGSVRPVFLEPVAWWTRRDLDVERMRKAAAYLRGEHDFRSFCVAESAEGRSTCRRIDALDIQQDTVLGETCLTVRVIGNAFLHSMVRVIAGSLVEVGLGRRAPEWIMDVLAARERSAAGPTAPAHGLTLWHVQYPDGLWL